MGFGLVVLGFFFVCFGVFLASNFCSLFGKKQGSQLRGAPVKGRVKAVVAQAALLLLSSDGSRSLLGTWELPKTAFQGNGALKLL